MLANYTASRNQEIEKNITALIALLLVFFNWEFFSGIILRNLEKYGYKPYMKCKSSIILSYFWLNTLKKI
jgi:hypothetical protein